MSSDQDLTKTYYELSGLYKNPTRALGGVAACNQGPELDAELVNKQKRLLALFGRKQWPGGAEKPALYYKILSLLYEVDDYRGASPSVKELILSEHSALLAQFAARQGGEFKNPEARSRWKAKALCCVAAIESRRKSGQPNALLRELTVLEEFIDRNLHKLGEGLPAWTTLAFVRAAQARVARQSQMYSYMREKLLSVVECLDWRVSEIVERLSALQQQGGGGAEVREEVERLSDDLVFIRRKQTLSTSFNVGLAELQRGSLRVAAFACQAAQLEFRLHGHLFHRLFNELVMLSIKRAQLSKKNEPHFLKLQDQLDRDILPFLKPEGDAGNARLYLYGLREKAVIQYYCGKFDDMLGTLNRMAEVGPSGPQWDSRISNHRARAHWHLWARNPGDKSLLRTALDYSREAFRHASGLGDGIDSYADAESLVAGIEGSERRNLSDTLESLITYGDVQVGFKKPSEAIKSASAVIELCKNDNPRLLAMGHLVTAEAHLKAGVFIEANQHLMAAKLLEGQIDHKYVADRIKAIEQWEQVREVLDLSDCGPKDFSKAQDLLLGWFIEHRTHMGSVNQVTEELGMYRRKIDEYLIRLAHPSNQKSPFRHQLSLKDKYKNKRRK